MPFDEIIVVSSDLWTRSNVRDTLVRLGFEPFCVSTIRECRQRLAARKTGLVFCDSHLSDGTYEDLLRIEPRPRLVVMSLSADRAELEHALMRGAFDVIAYPRRPTDVEWVVIQARRDEQRVESPGPKRIKTSEAARGAATSLWSGGMSRPKTKT